MPEQNTTPLRDYVEKHPRELCNADEVVAGGLDRLLRLVEPIVDRRDDDGPTRAA